MELIEGRNIQDFIQGEPIPVDLVVRWLTTLLETLEAVHERGVVHRDIKPSNLRVTDDGEVKLMDFGIARSEELTSITSHGGLVGTLAYMAPESLESGAVGPSSDLYALGVTAYELLTGKRPYPVPAGSLGPAADPIGAGRDDLDERLASILMSMIARKIENRPGSCREVLDRLAEWTAGASPFSRQVQILEDLAEGPLHSLKGTLAEIDRRGGIDGAREVLDREKSRSWISSRCFLARDLLEDWSRVPDRSALPGPLTNELDALREVILSSLQDGLGDDPPRLPADAGVMGLYHGTREAIATIRQTLMDWTFEIEEPWLIENLSGILPLQVEKDGVEAGVVLCRTPDRIEESVREIFRNLMENARNAAATRVVVRLTAEADADRFVIEINDDGPGFRTSDASRSFEKGYSGTGRGTGLGLSRCRTVARALGGELSIVDPASTGGRLQLILPKVVAHVPGRVVSEGARVSP